MDINVISEYLLRGWYKIFYIFWIGSFIIGMGYLMIMFFIFLFINELGYFFCLQFNFYFGFVFVMIFIFQVIVFLYWGLLVDCKGCKLMCMWVLGVMVIIIFLIGLLINVWMIIVLCFLQGVFFGYINNVMVLMVGEIFYFKFGWVMVVMMMVGVIGNFVGLLFGGILLGWFGY